MKNKANIKDLYTEDNQVFAVNMEYWKWGDDFYFKSTTVGFFKSEKLALLIGTILNIYEASNYGDFYTCYSVEEYGEGYSEVPYEPQVIGFREENLPNYKPNRPSLYERFVEHTAKKAKHSKRFFYGYDYDKTWIPFWDEHMEEEKL